MKRKHKKYSRPKQLYDKDRIEEENKLLKKYGLKNKREIWKTEAKAGYFRSRAKKLITSDVEDQEKFLAKLRTLGFEVKSIADVLALTKEDLMKRRLSSIIVSKGVAKTPKEARQMILHKRIIIKNKAVNVPSYIVRVDEENLIAMKPSNKKIVEVKQEDGN